MTTSLTVSELKRLEALRRYRILDTGAEEAFVGLATLASQICGAPIALVSFVDAGRQWFKARIGTSVVETPRQFSFCAHAIEQDGLFVVEDATVDPRFADNPLVTGDPYIRFYAGSPLIAPHGERVGTLCVIDSVPRAISEQQAGSLRILSREVVAQLEFRLAQLELNESLAASRAAEEALRASQEFNARLIASSRDCIKVLDLEGRLVSMNTGGMEVLEICDFAAVAGSFWLDFWRGKDREAAAAALDIARNGGIGRFVGFFSTVQTRQPRWWDVVVSSVPDAKGQPDKLLAVSRDVTAGKRAEELLRAITEGTAPVTGTDFFRCLVKHLATGLRVRFAFVAECLPQLRARSLAYWRDEAFGRDFEYALPGTPCMEVAQGRVCHVPDHLPEAFPEDKGMIDLGTVSYLGVPLQSAEKRTIGHLVIFDDKPMPPDPLVLSVMETFGSRAGAELEREQARKKLEAASDRRRTLLEVNNAVVGNLAQADLIRSIVRALARVLTFDALGLALHDPQSDTLRFAALEGNIHAGVLSEGAVLPWRESASGEAFQTRRPVFRNDLEAERSTKFEEAAYVAGVRSLCAVPMMVQGRVIGVISLASRQPRHYQISDGELLQEAGNQIALAVANMRAYEEIAALKAKLQSENLYLQEEIRADHNFEEIVGNSLQLIEVLDKVEQVAATDTTVLILGETGTGKELIARAIHDRSDRKNGPLVKINCCAISAGLVESELFGHVKGAFTGALNRRVGRFELADGGTIFLDEIGELPLETQVKLLRVLQEREFEPVGSSKTIRTNVRVIAATNRDLPEEIKAGKFRSDLFYRLSVFPIQVPPLRERAADVPLLSMFFLQQIARRMGKSVTQMPEETMARLNGYSWPGNIRELQNVIERGVILSPGKTLILSADFAGAQSAGVLPKPPSAPAVQAASAVTPQADVPVSMEDAERRHIETVLARTNWMIEGERGAARLLDLSPSTLRSRMQKLGIKRGGVARAGG